jgi:integrase
LRFGKWDEIDWEGAVWRVPAERTKLRRPHSVPLSRQSLELLRSCRSALDNCPTCFPASKFTVPICENAINLAFRRMGFDQDTVTAHGWRATASTLLNESGLWHFDAIERALAHGHSNAVRGTYARGQHWDERVKMAQWWSDYLDGLKRSVE